MENLYKKLYDYLNTQTEPKSIEEINLSAEFEDVPRREVVQMLQNLTAQQIAYRSLKLGKAYYSCKSFDGVDLNPVQRNIANVQAALNDSFSQKEQTEEEKKEDAYVDIMKKIAVFSNELGIAGEIPATSADVFELTYNEGTKFKNDKYSFAVPDGFILATGDDMGEEGILLFDSNENEDKRDFIAWLPDPKFPDSQEEALIRILPSMENNFFNYDLDVRDSEIYKTVFEYSVITGFANMGIADMMKTLDIPTNGDAYMCQYSANPMIDNYYVHFFPCGKDKQIRIDVKGVSEENKEKAHQMICELAHGFVSKDRLEPIKRLDDASYCGKKLTETIEKEWLENFNIYLSNGVFILQVGNLLAVKRAESGIQDAQDSFLKAEKETKKNMEKAARKIEEVLAQSNIFIKSVSSVNKGNKSLMNIYLEVIDFIERNKVVESKLNSKLYKEEIQNAEETLEIWKTFEIQELLHSKDTEIAKEEREEKCKQSEDVLKKTDDIVCEGRNHYQNIEKTWKKSQAEVQAILSTKTYMSENELKGDLRLIVRHRDEFGELYDELISLVDEKGKELINFGGDYRTVKKIAELIDEIIDESSTIDLDFTETGTISGNIGNTKFNISSSSKSFQKWWKEKYESMPEIHAENRKKYLTSEIGNIEESISDLEGKKDAFGRQERQLKDEIASLEKKIQEGESSLENAKNCIIEKAEQEMKKQLLKIEEAVKAKFAGEKKLDELMKQLDGLSIFKRSLKKDFTKQIEDLRGQISTMTSNIHVLEKVYEDSKLKRDFDVSALQDGIDDKKSKLIQKNIKFTQIPNEVKKNDQKIENEKAELEKNKAELAEVVELL